MNFFVSGMSPLLLSALFFALYVAVMIAIGVLSRRRSEEEFMIAGRKVAGLQMIATITAGFFDGAVLSIYIAYVFVFGLSALWLFVGIALGFLLFRRYARRIKELADRNKVYSMPEYFFRLLGKRNGLLFSALIALQFLGYLVINFIISGKVLAAIFPIPYWTCVLIGAAIILTYLLVAGFNAVVRTDFYQLFIMIVMVLLVILFLVGKTPVRPSDLSFTGGGAGDVIGFLFLAGLSVFVAPDLWQRVFAARDTFQLRRGLAVAAIVLPVLALGITLVGLATRGFAIVPEDALVAGFSHLLPFGVREFALVLLYAVALSSSDTVTFVAASIFTRDLKNYTRRYSATSMKRMTRYLLVLYVGLAAGFAVFFQRILDIVYPLLGLTLGLFPTVFGTLHWKLKERAVFWSLILTFAFVIGLSVSGRLTPETCTLALPVALVGLVALQLVLKDASNNSVHKNNPLKNNPPKSRVPKSRRRERQSAR